MQIILACRIETDSMKKKPKKKKRKMAGASEPESLVWTEDDCDSHVSYLG